MSRKIMMIAGEASGDLHGGKLIKALKERDSQLEFFGIGGDHMRSEGMKLYYHVDQIDYVGFIEVAQRILYFKKVFDNLLIVLKSRKPDIVIFIDYPGFNLRFARKTKALGYKTFYFIAPQVWAWGRGRAKKMAKFIDCLAVIFDFEKKFFTAAGVNTEFVGHPLIDNIPLLNDKKSFFRQAELDPFQPVLALLPGSRRQEVSKILPVLLKVAEVLQKRHTDLQVVISQASTIDDSFLSGFTAPFPGIKRIKKANQELLKYSTAAIVASGTATLEAAILKTPFCIVYKVSPISYYLGRMLVKIRHIGIVNIVGGEEIVKEFIQANMRVNNLVPFVEDLLYNENMRATLDAKFDNIMEKLGSSGAARKTAKKVSQMLGMQ